MDFGLWFQLQEEDRGMVDSRNRKLPEEACGGKIGVSW